MHFYFTPIVNEVHRKVFETDNDGKQIMKSYIGKDGVMQIIEENIDPITLSEYPKTEKYLLDMRNRINREIAKYN